MPERNVAGFDADKAATDFNRVVKDAAYVLVGLGVLGFQRAQVRRVEFAKQLEPQLAGLVELTSSLNSYVDGYVVTAQKQVADLREQLSKLPADLRPEGGLDPGALRAQLAEMARSIDAAATPLRRQLDEQLDRLEAVLPEPARELVSSVRVAAAAQEQSARRSFGFDGPDDAAGPPEAGPDDAS